MADSTGTNVLVLLSGGIDSATCVEYYTSRHYSVSALFVDYSQPDVHKEKKAARAISDYYSIPFKFIVVSGCHIPKGYIPSRNAVLLTLALLNSGMECGIISLGIHAGTPYADCSEAFEHLMQQVYDLYENGRIRIDAPFLLWTKNEIWDYARQRNVPLHLTHSTNIDDLRPLTKDKKGPHKPC